MQMVAGLVATLSVTATLGAMSVAPGMALAASGAKWQITSTAEPTEFAPASTGDRFLVVATNVGSGPSSGTVTITDTPPGSEYVQVTAVEGDAPGKVSTESYLEERVYTQELMQCEVGPPTRCEYVEGTKEKVLIPEVLTTKEGRGPIEPGDSLVMMVTVNAAATPPSPTATNSATVSEAGSVVATTGAPTTVPTSFGSGAASFGAGSAYAAVSSSQAGAHPNLTINFALNQRSAGFPSHDLKSAELELPAGLIGNPTAVPQCSMSLVERYACPADTAVGFEMTRAHYPEEHGKLSEMFQAVNLVYNIKPYKNEPAAFAFAALTFPVRIDTQLVRGAGGGYRVRVAVRQLSEAAEVLASSVTLWGVPQEHNGSGIDAAFPVDPEKFGQPTARFGSEGNGAAHAFLTNPTECGAGGEIGLGITGWPEYEGAKFVEAAPQSLELPLEAVDGCERLALAAALRMLATTHAAGAPAGYEAQLEVPQHQNPKALATPEVRDVSLQLPEGTRISAAAANGLVSCSATQFGEASEARGKCPQASRLGSVKIATPLLALPLEGALYAGQPECAPCTPADAAAGRLVPLLLEAAGSGVVVKLKGAAAIDQSSGRITATFDEDPQLPFGELTVAMKGGPHAPLVNPAACGPVVATAKVTPWSSAVAADLEAAPIPIESCTPRGFTPTLEAGMTKAAAGGSFSPLSVTVSRPDGQQSLGAVTVHLPAGVAGMISRVPLCHEAQANAGTCPASSQIGTTTAVIGPGSQPYTIEGGRVYLTEGYKGAPFGLSIVVPAVAGPFHLAGTNGTGDVVVRSAIGVDPHTAAVTVTTNALPTELDGIPLDIDRVIVNVNREGFMFNPTNCNAMSVTGAIASSSGTTATVSYPFQASNCATLPFHPKFTAEIHARHTKRIGEYLHVGVRSAFGQANIHEVHVTLPGKLPSRLNTLKHACTEQQFNTNPAGCPAESIVGHAVAHTPMLPVPITGPAIFVSHAGLGFPNLDLVLQGDGVHITLVGDTHINEKTNITTSTFREVPDVPVSRFDLYLPAGPHSALAGNGNMCEKPLYMPTTITGQNGAVVQQKTRIKVHGCKPGIRVLGHKVKGDRASIRVSVPAAGKLIANGKGIERAVRRVGKAKVVSIAVRLSSSYRKAAKRQHLKVRVKVNLRFKPNRGKTLHAQTRLLLR